MTFSNHPGSCNSKDHAQSFEAINAGSEEENSPVIIGYTVTVP